MFLSATTTGEPVTDTTTKPRRRPKGAVEADRMALDNIAEKIHDVSISATHGEMRAVLYAILTLVESTGR